jgi:hypothetical protein
MSRTRFIIQEYENLVFSSFLCRQASIPFHIKLEWGGNHFVSIHIQVVCFVFTDESRRCHEVNCPNY